jgi:Methyltransferase domain
VAEEPTGVAGAPDRLSAAVHDGTRAAWTLAAIAVAFGAGEGQRRAAARAVLDVAGIDVGSLDPASAPGWSAQAIAPLIQAATAVTVDEPNWADQPDAVLIAQGRASAQRAPMLAQMVPRFEGLAELLAAPDAAILDVGTGTAALAVAYAQAFPGVRVVGLDVVPRVIALAEATIAASSVADRVEIRQQSVAELDETERYAYAWLPAPFVPEPALRDGVRRIAAALVPGGWVALASLRFGRSPVEDAVARFTTINWGGTPVDAAMATEL